jgi:hypothetical protein
MPSAAAQENLASGYAEARPFRTVNFNGQELALRETQPERQERLSRVSASMARAEKEQEKTERSAEAQRIASEKKAARDSQIQTYMDVGYSRKEATMLTDNASAFTTMRGQDMSAAAARQALAAAKERVGGQPSTDDGRVTLPSITEALENFRKITPDQLRKISALGVSSASQGQQQGGFKEIGLTGAGALFGVIGDSEKRYAQQAGAIADAVARLSEVGVLTNFDVNRFRSQIMFSPGDSETLKQEKLKRAIAWGNWMSSNQKNMESGQRNKITATPESQTRYQIEKRKDGESLEAYYARTGGR